MLDAINSIAESALDTVGSHVVKLLGNTPPTAWEALGNNWTLLTKTLQSAAVPYVGAAGADAFVHTLTVQATFHTFFWPTYTLFRYVDRNNLMPQYKLHPDKWAPTDLNERVWAGLLNPTTRTLGIGRMVGAFFVFFYKRQSITEFPSFTTLVKNQVLAYLLNDFFFYVQHRALHEVPSFYKKYHKQHHEFKVTNVGATSWNNWEESFGIMLSAMLTGMTLFEYLVWTVQNIFMDLQIHSGYVVPLNPYNVINHPEFHDYHHYKNVGNYAAYTPFWDWLFGTDKKYKEWKRQQAALGEKAADDGPTLEEPFEAGFGKST
ncbi:hypothetical protein M427DRAFT_269747 [Gonapodya prolifera JEL478]|uniref:Fatty acid hydroxylase domain-containing protein n=1 Tax=Gonapodya prolifera (strain JEL478) TaxID=1344416 RepID=A0A139AJU1_GONPJ|nr:hypothetical protein M427DRAFT_269747 [Gonapodya prolifera JEL478]|eukprot:KXS17076.1 hypothetical protein M427DRAFT_269747 [Gonapodya prolifera JEL478]